MLGTNEPHPMTFGLSEPSARGRGEPLTFARFVTAPENRSAFQAVQDLAGAFGWGRSHLVTSPLFLHGPAGTGKTHLVSALVTEVVRQAHDTAVTLVSGAELRGVTAEADDDPLHEIRQSDLLVVEDVQHLGPRGDGALVRLLDDCTARRRPVVCTAHVGPAQIRELSGRLVSRLAAGLVVGIEPLLGPSRLAVLQAKAQYRQLVVPPETLAWLAQHLVGGGRQLDGALARLETLARVHPQPLDVGTVACHFQEQAAAARPTVERITQRVSGYFQVAARQLRSQQRTRHVLLPRQVGMYLARELTGLTLEQIGAYFGGRDHSTVLHACRKLEAALELDAILNGAVRELQAEFV